jgi:arylsulfatase A-like enzyme
MSTRPNVLTIICDDLRDTIDGIGGHPQLKTPNIDRLRTRGVRFTNAHCASPLCAPARAALWCGLYPHRTGNYSFGHWRDNPVLKEAVPIQEHFRRSGYKVYGTGKVNHNGQEDETTYDEWGWNDEFGPWPWKGSGRTWWTPHPDYVPLLEKTEPLVAPHAQVIEGLSGESSYGPLSNRPTWPEDPEGRWPGHNGWMLYDQPFRYDGRTDRDLMPDERSAEWAEEILQRSHAEPFMLMVGFNRPHTPLYVPDEYLERFPLDTLELPPHLEGDLDDCPADTMRAYQPYGFDRFTLIRKVGGPENLLRYVQAYLAAVAFVDDQVGRIVDALEASPYADNTTIVFTADHGYHLGEKDIIFKDSPWGSDKRPDRLCPSMGRSMPPAFGSFDSPQISLRVG